MKFATSLLSFAPLALATTSLVCAQETKLTASDGNVGHRFGSSVATSGNTALIGATGGQGNAPNSGAAYIFDVASGTEITRLIASDGASGDSFGFSVAIDGTTAIAGAPWYDSARGSAYLFDTSTGTQIAKLTASDGDWNDSFGYSVAIDGNIAIVGAMTGGGITFPGCVYVFDISTPSAPTETAKIFASDGGQGHYFGWSVAIDGNNVLVSATRFLRGLQDQVYLFDVSDPISPIETAILTASDGQLADNFGHSVALDGNTAIVGSPFHYGMVAQGGAAYLFDISDPWAPTETAKLEPADLFPQDGFGTVVAMDGATVLVSAFEGDGLATDSGSVYHFDISVPTAPTQISKIFASDGATGDEFGSGIGISGDSFVIGAPRDDALGFLSGSAYVISPDCNGNGIPDSQDIAGGTSNDCNSNSIPDECDIASGTSADLNQNGIPDECEGGGIFWYRSPINGNWYAALPALAWEDAQSQAQYYGGNLTTIRTDAENSWLATTFSGVGKSFWIGYSDTKKEGLFVWASGETPGYENWSPGEPDDLNGADWVVLAPSSGTWMDEPSAPERSGVIELVSGDCDSNWVPDTYEIALDPALDWNGDNVLDSCLGPNYCTANVNSKSQFAVMSVSGSPIITDNNFTITASQMPAGEWGYFLMAETQGFIPMVGGSAGNLCLGFPFYRFNNAGNGTGMVLNSGPTGTFSFSPNLTNLPQNVVFMIGETWDFQAWYRDGAASTSNFTDGIEVMFR